MVRKGSSSRKPVSGRRQRGGGSGGTAPKRPEGGGRSRAAGGSAAGGSAAGGAGTPAAAKPAESPGDIDALFQLPLSEFTAARNALAARLRKARRADEAAVVKALPRPTLVAWAVNQLYWTHRERFERLVATGERFYEAQMAQLSGQRSDLRAALRERREALSDMARLTADLLREAGHAAAPDTMRHVTTTLEALSSPGSAPQAQQTGRLAEEVLPPGFEALAPLVSRVGDDEVRGEEPTRVLPFRQAPPPARGAVVDPDARQRAEREAATAALEQAERDLARAREAAQQAETTLKQAAARAKEAEKEKGAAEARLAEVVAGAEAARAEALQVAAGAEEAAQALDDAERACAQARARLEETESVKA